MSAQVQRTTRRPTGKPSWPITLLAGGEKAGKSWACAEASASDLIGRTLWIGAGEDDPDEYGIIPGADFEIVEWNGTYRDLLDSIMWASAQDLVEGKPTLLVLDSMTRVWDLLVSDVQEVANRRARAKAEKYHKPVPAEDVQITMDLWNVAKDRWGHIMDALRAHPGPVLVTARLEEVTVMDADGKPTTEKMLKVKAEKSLPYDVGAIVEMPQRGETWLRGVRSARMPIAERQRIDGFTVDTFWRKLGLDGETGARTHSGVRTHHEDPREPESAGRDWAAEVEAQGDVEALRALYKELAESAETLQVKEQVGAAITARAAALSAGSSEPADAPDEPEKPKAKKTRAKAKPEDVEAAEASWSKGGEAA